MAEKKVLWLTGEKNPCTNQYEGVLINAGETYEAVNTYDYPIRVWTNISGDKPESFKIPDKIKWDDEEFDTFKELMNYDINEAEKFLDFLTGSEGEEIVNEMYAISNILVFDYENQEFDNIDNWITVKCYDYVCNSNLKTITLDTDNNYGYNEEYELEITDTYNLDYLERNNTNFEYGGMGNHALLHKVIIDGDKDDNRILWHEWSQWQGSELDSGCLMSVEDILERLENHPELEEIKEWLGVIE